MRLIAKSDVKFQVLDVECRPFLKSSKNQCESRSVPPSQFVKHQQKQHILERSSHIGTVSCLGYPSFNEVSMFGNVEQLL